MEACDYTIPSILSIDDCSERGDSPTVDEDIIFDCDVEQVENLLQNGQTSNTSTTDDEEEDTEPAGGVEGTIRRNSQLENNDLSVSVPFPLVEITDPKFYFI